MEQEILFQRVSQPNYKRYAVRSGDCDWQTVYTSVLVAKQFLLDMVTDLLIIKIQLTQDIQVIKDKKSLGKIILDFSPGSYKSSF